MIVIWYPLYYIDLIKFMIKYTELLKSKIIIVGARCIVPLQLNRYNAVTLK